MASSIQLDGKTFPRIGYGAMGLSAFYGTADPEQAKATLRRTIELGLMINTAVIYGPYTNEKLIGEVVAEGPRERAFVISKWGFDPEAFKVKGTPEFLHQSIDGSIERLGFKPDAYLQHRIDKDVPIEDSVKAMEEIRQAGKTKYIGLSECSAETLRRASKVAKIDFIEIEVSPWTLDHFENGVIDLAQELGTIVLAYSPLGRGFLTGKLKPADLEKDDWRKSLPRTQQDVFEHNMKVVAELEKIAQEKGCATGQLCLAWLLAKRPNIVPIPGTRSIERVEENLASKDIKLSEDDVKRIDQVIAENKPKGDRYSADGMKTMDN
ncbi:hypothetical protein OIO90_001971 [Microbotryomycetes sp. JL221]|nr:hypothetical protein OIO90_001971 [Microbotryomycetes sp. JL221]